MYGVLFSFYFADCYQRAPQVPAPGLLRQVSNLVDTLVPWVRLMWFLIQERQVGPQESEEGPSWRIPASTADPSAMEAASADHVIREACQETYYLCEELHSMVSRDISPLPAQAPRCCSHSVPSAYCLR